MPIPVVIDTNALPLAPHRPSAAFGRLLEVVRLGAVRVYLPDIVVREWRSQRSIALVKDIQAAMSHLDNIEKSVVADGAAEIGHLAELRTGLKQLITRSDELSEAKAAALVADLNAEVLGINPADGARVMQAYFDGSSPFRSRKSRDDIPDAFIYQAIVALMARPVADIHAVLADKRFVEHLKALGIVIHENLESFVTSDEVKESVIDATPVEKLWSDSLPFVLRALPEHTEPIVDRMSNKLVDAIAYKHVSHEEIPSDDNEAMITGVGAAENVQLDWEQATDYGPGAIRVPFTCTSDVEIDFPVFHSDAYGLDDAISVSYGDHEESHYFEAQAQVTVSVRGFVELEVINWEGDDAANMEFEDLSVDEVEDIDVVESGDGKIF